MAIAKGRNDLQASIEDYAKMLDTLACDIDSFYKKEIENINRQIKISDESSDDYEIKYSIKVQYEDVIELYESLHNQSFEMLISKIYSYAEKHMEELLKRISYSRNKSADEYKKDKGNIHGISDIEKHFYVIRKHNNLPEMNISEFWKDFKAIHQLRNNIEHHYSHSAKPISIEYIKSNIVQAEKMLLHIERITQKCLYHNYVQLKKLSLM